MSCECHHADTDDDDWSVVVVNSDDDDGSSAVAGHHLMSYRRSEVDSGDERSNKSSAAVDEDDLMNRKRSALLIRKQELEEELKDINEALCKGESLYQPASKDSKPSRSSLVTDVERPRDDEDALFIRRLREGASSSTGVGKMVKSEYSLKRKSSQLGHYMDDDEEDSEKTRSDAETGSVDFGAPSAARDEESKTMNKRDNGKTPMLCQPPRCHRVTLIPNTSKNTVIDLTGVPTQLPILKSDIRSNGVSKYAGVSFGGAVDRSSCKRPSISTSSDQGGKKRDLQPNHSNSSKHMKKRQKIDAFTIDLSDVPPQPPIPKVGYRIREESSKYKGVYFNKSAKKWHAEIYIDGKMLHIGLYKNEEEAATDYARALLKYRGQEALDKARKRNSSGSAAVDLSGVPHQLPILKSDNRIKPGASKYAGLYFNKAMNKWHAQIWFAGKQRHIGLYKNEEEAASDYARALLKYKGQNALDKAKKRNVPIKGGVCIKHGAKRDIIH